MIAYENHKILASKANSIHNTNENFRQAAENSHAEFIEDLCNRFDEAEKKEKNKRRRSKKNQPKTEPYRLINITFEAKPHEKVDAFICWLAYRTLKNLSLTPSKKHNYSHVTDRTALHRKTQHHGFKRLWWGIFSKHNKQKYKARRKFDGCNTHDYKDKPDIHILCYLQGHNCAYDGNVYPSRQTIAKHLNISIRRVDKALKNLVRDGDVHIKSGKGDYTTNTYYIDMKYQKNPLMNPSDYEHPFVIRCILNKKIKKAKCRALKKWIKKHFRREKKEFAHQSFQDIKQIRTCLLNSNKKFLRKSKDPPKSRGRPLFMGLLKEFKFQMKDNFILSHYGEAPLRAALDDYRFYLLQGKEIDNSMALICSRCKHHRKRLGMEPVKTPAQKFKGFVKRAKSMCEKGIATFIQKEDQIDHMNHDKVYIKLLKHKKTPEKSILYLWKRVNGYWVDKCIAFSNERFEELVEPFLKVV